MKKIFVKDFSHKYRKQNLKKMAQTTSNAAVRERLLALSHVISGKDCRTAAASLGRTHVWLRKWMIRFSDGGYENMFDIPRPGQPSFLSKSQFVDAKEEISKLHEKQEGGRITVKDITSFINNKYKKNYKYKSVFSLLKRMGMTWISARSIHPKSSEIKKNNFKKIFKARAKKIGSKKK